MRDTALPDLTGTATLVTGASGTIGAGIALRFAEAGSAVAVHYHQTAAGADAVVARIEAAGGRAVALAADLSDDTACHGLVRAAKTWAGRLDTLVNNAGIQPVEPLADMPTWHWRRMIDTNLTSAFSCTQAAAEAMTDGGAVIHIASIEATQPAPGHAHYSSAKAALVMHARAAALEYGPRGIRVNTVSPGLIDRPAWPPTGRKASAAGRTPHRCTRLGTPTDVAQRVRLPGLTTRHVDHRPQPGSRRRHLNPPHLVNTRVPRPGTPSRGFVHIPGQSSLVAYPTMPP